MLFKVIVGAAISIGCPPAICDELRSYTVIVMQQTRHEITVRAVAESAARTIGLLEARRISGSGEPRWEPSPPGVLAHALQAGGVAVIDIKRAPTWPGYDPGRNSLEMVASP
jgi:hypothetical protein